MDDNTSCMICPRGSYSDTETAYSCNQCQGGLTTVQEGSRNRSSCQGDRIILISAHFQRNKINVFLSFFLSINFNLLLQISSKCFVLLFFHIACCLILSRSKYWNSNIVSVLQVLFFFDKQPAIYSCYLQQ